MESERLWAGRNAADGGIPAPAEWLRQVLTRACLGLDMAGTLCPPVRSLSAEQDGAEVAASIPRAQTSSGSARARRSRNSGWPNIWDASRRGEWQAWERRSNSRRGSSVRRRDGQGAVAWSAASDSARNRGGRAVRTSCPRSSRWQSGASYAAQFPPSGRCPRADLTIVSVSCRAAGSADMRRETSDQSSPASGWNTLAASVSGAPSAPARIRPARGVREIGPRASTGRGMACRTPGTGTDDSLSPSAQGAPSPTSSHTQGRPARSITSCQTRSTPYRTTSKPPTQTLARGQTDPCHTRQNLLFVWTIPPPDALHLDLWGHRLLPFG
jgi:hypothetical protein